MGQGTNSWHSMLFGILAVIEVVENCTWLSSGLMGSMKLCSAWCHHVIVSRGDGFVVSEKVKFEQVLFLRLQVVDGSALGRPSQSHMTHDSMSVEWGNRNLFNLNFPNQP